MQLTECKITIMENLLFVSTEFGNEYHAYGFIGNTAIPYAIGLAPFYYSQFKKPMHRQHFKQLSERGIFITPATFIGDVKYKMERFNSMPDSYLLRWDKDFVSLDDNDPSKGRTENYPDEGVFKMISRGNVALFFIISNDRVEVPQYVRVGKFMSKCKIETREIQFVITRGDHDAGIILRAEDIDPSIKILEYEKVPVQHGMYLRNMWFEGDAISFHSDIGNVNIPVSSSFYAAERGA